MSTLDIREFTFAASDEALADLRQRLNMTRWPERETPDDWSQGVPLDYVQALCSYWASDYDWRRCETALNELPQFIAEIDGLDIQFIHIRSPEADAMPMIMTHGWPGSVLEFMKVIGPLTDPVAHGGKAEDAFHLVCPTLPGFGYSGKPDAPGWNLSRIAAAWNTLMLGLGYERYAAQGGDWGAAVTQAIAVEQTDNCMAMHTNMPLLSPSPAMLENLDDYEQNALAGTQYYFDWDSGYSKQQSTRPQTVGYGLVDSPVAQCAWIVEKFWAWMDCDGNPESVLSKDELLDNVMMYWLPAAGASSARMYWESFSVLGAQQPAINIPAAVSMFPHEIFRSSKRWCEERFKDLRHYNALSRGGHFAAFEQPDTFVDEMRTGFKSMR